MIHALTNTSETQLATAKLRAQGLTTSGHGHTDWLMWRALPLLRGDTLAVAAPLLLDNLQAQGSPDARIGVDRLVDVPPESFDTIVHAGFVGDGTFITEAAQRLRPGGRLLLMGRFGRASAAGVVMQAAAHGLTLRAEPLYAQVSRDVPTLFVFHKAARTPRVLIVNHAETACGVYQFGCMHARLLARSQAFTYDMAECTSPADLRALRDRADVYIFNYNPVTMPWADRALVEQLRAPCIGIDHGVTVDGAARTSNALFHHWIANEPALAGASRHLSFVGRPLLTYDGDAKPPAVPTLGTFGFGSVAKGHRLMIERAGQQLGKAVVRFRFAIGAYGDPGGDKARAMIAEAQAHASRYPGISVEFSHDFLAPRAVLDFLASNTLNLLFYSDGGSGLSSALDYALAVPRPVALTRATMFRHVLSFNPPVCIDDHTLPEIIARGATPLDPFRLMWSRANLIRDFDGVVARILKGAT